MPRKGECKFKLTEELLAKVREASIGRKSNTWMRANIPVSGRAWEYFSKMPEFKEALAVGRAVPLRHGAVATYTRKNLSEGEVADEGGLGNEWLRSPHVNKYVPSEVDELAYNYSLLGATWEELAKLLKVGWNTVTNWYERYESFKEAVDSGREAADARVARALYTRAVGYRGKKTIVATHQGSITDVKEVSEEVAPDVNAAKHWLACRQPKRWTPEKDDGGVKVKVDIRGDMVGQKILGSAEYRRLASALLLTTEESSNDAGSHGTDSVQGEVEDIPSFGVDE